MIFPSRRWRNKLKMASSLRRCGKGPWSATGTDYIFVFPLLIVIPIVISDFIQVIVLNVDLQMHRVAVVLAPEITLLLCGKKRSPDVLAGHLFSLKIGASTGSDNRLFLSV
jgi:hypothetical protein